MKKYFNNEKIRQTLKHPEVKTTILISAGLIIVLLIFWLIGLFSTPSNYKPVKFISDGNVSLYLSNYIIPRLYNSSQYGRPFELVLSENGINDIIIRHIDVNNLRQANLSDLSVTFRRGKILLTAKIVYYGFDFVVTLALKPYIDKEGYFQLEASEINAGKSRIPFIAESVKGNIVQELEDFLNSLDIDDAGNALLNNEKIEPVFSINHRKHRIEKIIVEDGKMIIHFQPLRDVNI